MTGLVICWGKRTGVAKRISELQPKAFVTHCHGHSLSLSVKDTVKDCQLLSQKWILQRSCCAH